MTDLWPETLSQLRQQLTPGEFHWLATSTADETGEGLTVHLASAQAAEYADHRLRPRIELWLRHVAGRDVVLSFVANGVAPAPAPELPPPPDPAPAPDLAGFDFYGEGGGGWVRFPHYGPRFTRPYLGDEAFDIWEYIRARSPDALISWTPPIEITGAELALAIRANVQRVVGVWRQCKRFNKAYFEDGEVWPACCGDHAGEIGLIRSRLYPEGRPACRFWVPGALEILEQEALAAIVKHGTSPRSTFYTIQVYQRLPLLTPFQVDRLPGKLQVAHARFLRKRGLADVWRQQYGDLYSMLALGLDETGLELEPADTGVFRARARKESGGNDVFRARARKETPDSEFFRARARNIIFFPNLSRALHEKSTATPPPGT